MLLSGKLRYSLSAVGLLFATASIMVALAIPVFAACSANVTCPDGSTLSCSCPGNGVCNSGATYIQCICAGSDPMEPACCGGTCS